MSRNILAFALILEVGLLVLAVELALGDVGLDLGVNRLAKQVGALKTFSIPSWTSYMQSFNKRYSSLSQQLLRQKLFMARAIEVFLTGVKYRLLQLSYFTAINEHSDSTPDECRRKLSGDGDEDEASDDEPPMLDDEEAERMLLEMLNERSQNDDEDARSEEPDSKEVKLERRRRSAEEMISLPAPIQDRPNIRWKVPSENPDYEPIYLDEGAKQDAAPRERIVDDIPADRVAEIEIATSQNRFKLAEIASEGFGRVKSMVGGAVDWLSPSPSGDGDGEGEMEGKASGGSDSEQVTVIRDWRQSGCIGPVRNQGDCLSCYAVSAMGFMEWALCREHGNQLTPLSVQYMISCGPQYKLETGGRVKLDGCDRGASRQTGDFIREYGIELEANMPYLERDTVCPLAPHTPRKRKGYIRPNTKPVIRLKSKTSQLDLALETGPVIVGMREPKNFLAYGGGMVEHCYQQGGHAMLIVGAMVENGIEYLLIKNSFGNNWGYGGYFKFKRSAIVECVKEFIVLRVTFPGRKAQARRIKAYLADTQTIKSNPAAQDEEPEMYARNIFA